MQSSFNVNFLGEAIRVAVEGLPITIGVTLVALVISIPLSFLFATMRMRNIPIISQLIKVYVSFVRGTPILIQIFIIYPE